MTVANAGKGRAGGEIAARTARKSTRALMLLHKNYNSSLFRLDVSFVQHPIYGYSWYSILVPYCIITPMLNSLDFELPRRYARIKYIV